MLLINAVKRSEPKKFTYKKRQGEIAIPSVKVQHYSGVNAGLTVHAYHLLLYKSEAKISWQLPNFAYHEPESVQWRSADRDAVFTPHLV